MQIDTYEIKLLNEQDEIPILDNILYECQCALFLLDITNSASLEQIKKVMKTIEKQGKLGKIKFGRKLGNVLKFLGIDKRREIFKDTRIGQQRV